MASKSWIKLWIEILNDPKMMTLPDELFSLAIKLFLLAGEMEQGGTLPDKHIIAWRLRLEDDVLAERVQSLVKTGILTDGDGLMVTKFAARQGPDSSTERWQRWNDRQQKDRYYANDNPNEDQTIRLQNKNKKENKNKNENENKEQEGEPASGELVSSLLDLVSSYDFVCSTLGETSIKKYIWEMQNNGHDEDTIYDWMKRSLVIAAGYDKDLMYAFGILKNWIKDGSPSSNTQKSKRRRGGTVAIRFTPEGTIEEL